MKIKILADSTCDLPKQMLAEHDITLVPLTVVKGEEQFKDGVTITPADIFDHVAAGGALCSTAANSIGEYADLFEQYHEDYDGILVITIGSGFSSCYQNACLAAEDYPNVRIIDSRNLTSGQGLVVLKACSLAKEVSDLDELANQLQAYTEKIDSGFIVEKLDYLVKGGRCSSAAALGANLLNLKPSIDVKNGKMSVGKKYRGAYTKCLTAYIQERFENRDDIDWDTLFFVHTVLPEEYHEVVMDALQSCGKFQNIYEATAGCTVSCHCGPGTVGIVFAKK